MKELESFRKEIDSIDAELCDLFCRRMEIVEKIALCKKEASLPIFDRAREEEILSLRTSECKRADLLPYYEAFLESLLKISKDYQRKLGGKA